MKQLPKISPITNPQRQQVYQVLARAFHHDPLMVFYFTDEEKRDQRLALTFEMILKFGQKHGEVYGTEANEGAAIWTGPGNVTLGLGEALRSGIMLTLIKSVFVFSPAVFNRFSGAGDYIEENHQRLIKGRSHWHLQILGVEPDKQGQGIGGALIQPILSKADRDHLPCYLDTMNEKNLPFYEKYDFKVANQENLPKGGPVMWSMIRESGH